MKRKHDVTRWLVMLLFAACNALPFVSIGQPVTFTASTCSIYTYNGTLSVAVADINGDGKPDLISANGLANTLTVLTNNGSGIFGSNAIYSVGINPQWVVAADLNGDGAMDVVCANGRDNTLTVLTNNGSGLLVSNATYSVGSNPSCVVAVDINGDGKLDLVCANGSDRTLTVLTNSGNGVFGFNAILDVGWFPRSVVAADVNGDGKVDLISANNSDASLTVLTNNGMGHFGFSATLPVGGGPFCVVAADINGDGVPDLISANGAGGNTLSVWTNNGSGVFGSNATLQVGPVPYSVVAADVNGDGKADLISLNNGNSSLNVLTNNGSGVFGSNTMLFAPGLYPQCMVAADLNGDKKPDLVFANSQGGLTVLLNTTMFPPPFSLTPPVNQVVVYGGTAMFTVAASGPGPFTYQWQFNGTNLPNNIITTVAGNGGGGRYAGDGGPATNATFWFYNNFYDSGVALDGAGDLFIADTYNERVREVGINGYINTVAGKGIGGGGGGYSGDGGMATNSTLNNPAGVAVDDAGNLFISDVFNNRVRKVGTNGVITTVAGGGPGGLGDGGAATNAILSEPAGVAVDRAGNLYVADYFNYRIRKVGTNGIITTVAGNGTFGNTGDGSPAISAELRSPTGVAVDGVGNLFIADISGNCIRKVGTNGVIATVAGNGSGGYFGDGGAAASAELNSPAGVAVDGAGRLFIADSRNSRIRMVATNGIITTVAGGNYSGFAGDGGPATNALLSGPEGVAVDGAGNVFFLDSGNLRIREVGLGGYPTLRLSGVSGKIFGSYRVIVTSSSGSVTSNVAVLTALLPPGNFSISSTNGNQLCLQLTGTTNYPYILQAAANLTPPVDWEPIATNNTDSRGNWSFVMTNPPVVPAGYFRAVGW